MNRIWIVAGILLIGIWACQEVEYIGPLSGNDLQNIPYAPTPHTVEAPQGFPAMEIPADNPMTKEGIELGRHLFYDPILSRDSTISCSSCHDIRKAFTDGRALAVGIDGRVGVRSSMSLINVGYSWIKSRAENFMWDGRFATLEEQALEPIENPLEMDESWAHVEKKLRRHADYPKLFRQAFGITSSKEIDRYLAAKALAQFERTLNSANSPYDSIRWTPFSYLSSDPLLERGFRLFQGDADGAPIDKDAECAHCHSFSDNKMLFARNNFSNNGLETAATFFDFPDNGFGNTTGNYTNNGQFREVTVRNIALTAPYMHDGRFASLRDVLDHYVSGGHPSPNVANELTTSDSLTYLTEQDKDALETFLLSLTDTAYFHKEAWRSPF